MPFNPKQERIQDNLLPANQRDGFVLVDLGFSQEQAILEASRCLQCANPTCQQGCPIHLPIKECIGLIREGKIQEARNLIDEVSPISHVCSLTCDYKNQCEGNCIRNKNQQAVSIHNLHRFICENSKPNIDSIKITKKEKVAVIGSGPAGLSCAYELIKLGYPVALYEKEDRLGGVPSNQIPTFRLDSYEQEINEFVNALPITVIKNKEVNITEIKEEYAAIVLAIGTQEAKKMHIPGEELANVITSNEFLDRIKNKDGKEYYKQFKNAFVIGGGNVAMDCVRSAVRICEKANLVYRRSLAEAPAKKEEVEQAVEEGVNLLLLNNPVRYIGQNTVEKIELIKMNLGEPDASGRASFIPIENSNYQLDADLVILAISSNPEIIDPNLNVNRNNTIVTNNYQTNMRNVFAIGDAVNGPNTVVGAIASGKDGARYINSFLKEN